ncbi:hypothetical protein BT96DRAFT_486002 [Gymnopus androsaceus JB14]|uniref:Uncharacterized protein n=1 Tax=Gymnopus androsaceus JB14 TaxID=1447944 RepID=A0A6A4HZR6_9AGAR|nr:hypothetical protein BT96DRAFT_486002 [Gymnopus androsaceus JB14]
MKMRTRNAVYIDAVAHSSALKRDLFGSDPSLESDYRRKAPLLQFTPANSFWVSLGVGVGIAETWKHLRLHGYVHI